MRKVLILLVLVSCRLLTLDDGEIKIKISTKKPTEHLKSIAVASASRMQENSLENLGRNQKIRTIHQKRQNITENVLTQKSMSPKNNTVVDLSNQGEASEISNPENMQNIPNIIEPSVIQQPTSLLFSQEGLNQLWVKNLQSKINYTWIWDGKKTQHEKVNIEDNGNFEIIHDKMSTSYQLTKAISDSEALYNVLTRVDNGQHTSLYYIMVLKIRDQNPYGLDPKVIATYTNNGKDLDGNSIVVLNRKS